MLGCTGVVAGKGANIPLKPTYDKQNFEVCDTAMIGFVEIDGDSKELLVTCNLDIERPSFPLSSTTIDSVRFTELGMIA